jgi:hypothetical protein
MPLRFANALVSSPLHYCATCTQVFATLLVYNHKDISTYRIPGPSQRIASFRSHANIIGPHITVLVYEASRSCCQ